MKATRTAAVGPVEIDQSSHNLRSLQTKRQVEIPHNQSLEARRWELVMDQAIGVP